MFRKAIAVFSVLGIAISQSSAYAETSLSSLIQAAAERGRSFEMPAASGDSAAGIFASVQERFSSVPSRESILADLRSAQSGIDSGSRLPVDAASILQRSSYFTIPSQASVLDSLRSAQPGTTALFSAGTGTQPLLPSLTVSDRTSLIASVQSPFSCIPSASTWNQNTVLLANFNFDATTPASARSIDSSDVAIIQNVITANNNQPVAVTAATQRYDLNGNRQVDSGDVALMNNIVNFANLPASQQASTFSALTPQLASVVVNSIVAQATTDETRAQSYTAVAAIFERMQAGDAAAVVDAVVATANGAQTAGKIFDRMSTDRAAAVCDHIADPEGVNDAQAASSVIENMSQERAIALIGSRSLQTGNCALILTKMSSTKLEWAATLMQAMDKDRAVSVVKQMERLPIARIIGKMQAQDAAEIIGDHNMPVETAAKILDLVTDDQAYKILAKVNSPLFGGSSRTASILSSMDQTQAAKVFVRFYDAYKQQAGDPENKITAIPAFLTLMMRPQLSTQELSRIFEHMDPAKAAEILTSVFTMGKTFTMLASKASAVYKNLPDAAQALVAAKLGTELANAIKNYKPPTTHIWTDSFGEVNIRLNSFDDPRTPNVNEATVLTPENIDALDIASVGAGVTVTYADGTTRFVWQPVGAGQINVFGNVELLIEPDILRDATSVAVQLYYWKEGDTVDQAHARTLGETVTSDVRLSTFITELPQLSVASGRPGQDVTFKFSEPFNYGRLIGGGVWIDYTDPNKQDEFYMLDDFEYMIQPDGTFSMQVPAGVKSLKFYGQEQHGSTRHFTYSTTVTF